MSPYIYIYIYICMYLYINKYIYNYAEKSLKRTASYRIGTQLEPQATESKFKKESKSKIESRAIELKLIKNPLLTNLLPVGLDTLRIESVSESRCMESKTNSLEINSLYKKSNRNRQKRTGTTLYIYIYIRATPGFCPGVAAYICPIHEQMMLQITVIPMGKITQVLETIKQTRSKHPKFLWEKQKRHNTCNSYGKNSKGTSKF